MGGLLLPELAARPPLVHAAAAFQPGRLPAPLDPVRRHPARRERHRCSSSSTRRGPSIRPRLPRDTALRRADRGQPGRRPALVRSSRVGCPQREACVVRASRPTRAGHAAARVRGHQPAGVAEAAAAGRARRGLPVRAEHHLVSAAADAHRGHPRREPARADRHRRGRRRRHPALPRRRFAVPGQRGARPDRRPDLHPIAGGSDRLGAPRRGLQRGLRARASTSTPTPTTRSSVSAVSGSTRIGWPRTVPRGSPDCSRPESPRPPSTFPGTGTPRRIPTSRCRSSTAPSRSCGRETPTLRRGDRCRYAPGDDLAHPASAARRRAPRHHEPRHPDRPACARSWASPASSSVMRWTWPEPARAAGSRGRCPGAAGGLRPVVPGHGHHRPTADRDRPGSREPSPTVHLAAGAVTDAANRVRALADDRASRAAISEPILTRGRLCLARRSSAN